MPADTAFIKLDDAEVQAAFRRLLALGADTTPLMQDVAGILHDEVEENFRAEGRPRWTPLAPSTLRKRRQAQQDARILQLSGRLAGSITPSWGKDHAEVGTNVVYARIQHFGGTIHRAPYSTKVRHATDRSGAFVRQGKGGRLLRFAKDSAKQAKTRWFEVKPYDIRIPARPFMSVPDTGLAKIVDAAKSRVKAASDKGF